MAQFNALVERYTDSEEKLDFRAGLVCAVIANVNRGKGKTFKPQDFMPGKKKGKLPTIEEMRLMNIAAGGKDIAPEEVPGDISMEEAKAKMALLKEESNGK